MSTQKSVDTLDHPDLSVNRELLDWLWIDDHIWNKEIA
jgi:hypothetical protein